MNIELAKKVIDYIDKNPDQHEQGTFVNVVFVDREPCGTTCCIAGHAMLLSGEYITVLNEPDPDDPYDVSIYFANSHGPNDLLMDSERGRILLDLTVDQADQLFFNLQDEGDALDYLRTLVAWYEQPATERDELVMPT